MSAKGAAALSAAESPTLKPQLDAALIPMLAGVPDGVAKSDGIQVGRTAAASIIALLANDGITARETYRPQTVPQGSVDESIVCATDSRNIKGSIRLFFFNQIGATSSVDLGNRVPVLDPWLIRILGTTNLPAML